MKAIDIGGVRYIKASEAAAQFGYTADYVGQLARAGKIEATQFGRSWYVREDHIMGHKNDVSRSNKQKTREGVQKAVEEKVEEHAIYNSLIAPSYMPEYRKRLLDTPVHYEADTYPLQPTISKDSEPAELVVASVEKDDLVVGVKLGREVPLEESSERQYFEAVRPPDAPLHGALSVVSEDRDSEAEASEPSNILEKEIENKLLREATPPPVIPRALQGGESHADAHTQLSNPPKLSIIPPKGRGRRRALALGRRVPLALVPVAFFAMCVFTLSSIFLERVVSYEHGASLSMVPLQKTFLQRTQMANLYNAISRLSEISSK